jgi:hypothetical protein
VMRLEGVAAASVQTPAEYLALVHWFVQIAMLAQRIPILPEMPCALTRMEWPGYCADGRPPLGHGAPPAATSVSKAACLGPDGSRTTSRTVTGLERVFVKWARSWGLESHNSEIALCL